MSAWKVVVSEDHVRQISPRKQSIGSSLRIESENAGYVLVYLYGGGPIAESDIANANIMADALNAQGEGS